MKYFTIITGILLAAAICVLGYFEISGRATQAQSTPRAFPENTDWKPAIAKLQKENAELKDTLAKQYVFIQKLKEDSLTDSTRIVKLEKELRDTIAVIQALLLDKTPSGPDSISKDKTEQPVHFLDPLLNQIMSGEIFKDPQFAKIFQEQIGETIKTVPENERKKETEKLKEQLQQRLVKRIEDLSKTLNLNEYQQQEFAKALSDNGSKTIDMFSQFREQKLSAEEFRIKRETFRTEATDKIKQILLPEQFEQYQKSEASLFRGIMPGAGKGGGNLPAQPNK